MRIALSYAHSGPPSLFAELCRSFIFAFLIMLSHLHMAVFESTKDMINYQPIYLNVEFDYKFSKGMRGHEKSQLNSVSKLKGPGHEYTSENLEHI